MLGTTEDGGWLFWREMASGSRSGGSKRQVILFILGVCACQSGAETLRYSLAEEMERDSFVANIAKDLGVAPEQLAARKARVVSEGNEQRFRLNQNTGVLTAKESLDREEICPQSDTCTLFFKIFFENPVQLIRGEVEVRDVNDNPPVFPEKEMVLEIPETTPPGSRFPLESAQDTDMGSNGLQNYSLGSNSHFSLAFGTGKDGVKYAELVLERQLDREEQPELNLLLTATDGGSPPRSGTAQIRIVVLDANDNIPIFSREVYEVRLAENSPPEQLVVRVAAADPDEGSYGQVRYAFTQTSERSRQLFELNPATGEIRVAGNLDFEEAKSHKMVVKATDGGGLSAHCKVQVEVLDVNDNAPEIALTSLSASIPEDAPPRTVVALFSVRDRDSGDNGRTECVIDGDLPFSLSPAFDNYYELRTSAALDRERTAEYNISITALDWGAARLSSRESLLVQISDVNDNAPEFTQEVYTLWVTENNSPMLRIGSVNATDADAGKNARVNYALVRQEGKEQPDVSVSSENGDVYVLRPLDFEEVRAFEVAVRAADGGSPPLSAQAVLRVVVRDENDNAPVVLHPPAESSAAAGELVPRWARAGYLVAKVVAVDADAGQNAWLSYELAKATEPGLFRVGLHSGEVRTARAVAERDAPRQRLVVLVRDRGQPPRSATATLGIALVDGFSDAHLRGSEEAPAAEPDGPLTLSLIACLACVSALFVATAVATVVAKVRRARRSEAEPLPTFPRAATESNAGSLPRSYVYDVCFAAGTVNSEFRFLRPLLPCLPAGLPPGPGDQRSSVCSQEAANVGEEGDWAAQGRASLSEDTAPRRAEAACPANRGMELRDNSDPNPWLTHHVKTGVGEREGARPPPRRAAAGRRCFPRRTARPRRETEAVRRPAMAIARQVLCLSALLSLPHARPEPLRYSVAEEGESGSVVANVAEDAGLAPAQLSARRARLASEDGRQPLRLDRGTGRLVVAQRLDREELCGQSATCTLPFELLLAEPLQFFRVEVAVEDINDHSPVFPEEQVTFKIPETSNPGSRFPLEGARDLDVGSNSIQAYRIAPDNEYFTVSFVSRIKGKKYVELVLEKPLDREEQEEMSFSLIAVDGGSPPRSGTTQIRIVVLDANDNAPVFTQDLYIGQVLENAPEGSVVLRVVATDLDAGPNGDIVYQFSQAVGQSSSAFVIDPTSGEIKLTKPLDFEAAETHELSVRATDGGGLSAICKVLVEVVDVNDNAPELVVSSFSSPLPENASPGTVVALFTVRDRDAGANGKLSCALEDQFLFSLRPAYKNYYELVTVSALDREETAQYILTVIAADAGTPPLTTTQTFTVDISDVNDNAPVFNQTSYTMHVRENNVPTVLVGAVSARDADVGPNAKVTYSLAPSHPTERPPCSCISVNSENGHVFVLRSLDYEQVRQIEVSVSASDAGSPPLSANVTLRLVVVDENDNAPLVLHPAQDSSPPSSELVPTSAEAGYLISKVVAVDADSGQNSWLSYHLLRATDPGLFAVGAQSGEVRLRRPVTERDAVKQKLVILVRDNGRPPLSATAALSALLLSDFSDMRLPHSSLATEDEGGSLTTYLIISLVLVSLLFLVSTAAFVTCKVCKSKALKGGHVLYGPGNLQSDLADAATAGTLPHAYCYEISLTTGSGNSEFKFLKPILPSLPPRQCAMMGGTEDEQDFPRGPVAVENMAAENAGMLSGEQFNSLSFN
ncbi:uncharacterized protein RG961_006837 [Leptosomus discolor]